MLPGDRLGPGGHPILGEEGEETAGVLLVAAHSGLGAVCGAQVSASVGEEFGEVADVHCGESGRCRHIHRSGSNL